MWPEKHLTRQISVYILEPLLLEYSKNVVFFFKIFQNKVKGPFCLESAFFCYVTFGGYHFFLNKTLDKVYSKQLRDYNLINRKKYIYT